MKVRFAITAREQAAFERLLTVAATSTTEGKRAADFLLAWWNAGNCGGFDFTNVWGVEGPMAADMVTVFAYFLRVKPYPSDLGYYEKFQAVIARWRPTL
jgi:hypothetical protein